MDPARERIRAGLAESLLEPRRNVVLLVEAIDLDARVGEPAGIVGPHRRRDVTVQVLLDRPLLGLRLLGRTTIHAASSRVLFGALDVSLGGTAGHRKEDRVSETFGRSRGQRPPPFAAKGPDRCTGRSRPGPAG